ncbi:uncharacterized protein LOC141913031 [Tubulanus polymorphus]|uniref:uncharacterized protein LOC141913031 n=1 Tax=Tubulanus polymorphus TaxID=672921 RepID=UPI003DA28007
MSEDILEQAARRQHRRHPGAKTSTDSLDLNSHAKKDDQSKSEDIEHDTTSTTGRRRRLQTEQPLITTRSDSQSSMPPFIRFKCQKEIGKALLDSTSPISTVNSQFSQQVGLMSSKGNLTRNVELTLANKDYKIDLKVIGDGPDITIGLDFLQKYKCLLNFGCGTLSLGETEIQLLYERDIPLRFRSNIASSASILSQTI